MTTIRVSGPLFGSLSRPLDQVERKLVQAFAERGEERLKDQLKPTPGVFHSPAYASANGYTQTGNYRRSVQSERRGRNVAINDSGVVYGPWLEGTSSRNNTTRFKGYQTFRKTATWLEQNRGRIISDVRGLVDPLT